MSERFCIEIVRFSDGVVVSRMETYSERMADRIDSGANINLNHEDYYTRIIDRESPPEDWTETPVEK